MLNISYTLQMIVTYKQKISVKSALEITFYKILRILVYVLFIIIAVLWFKTSKFNDHVWWYITFKWYYEAYALISRKDGSLIKHEDIWVFNLGNFEFDEHLVIHFETFEFQVWRIGTSFQKFWIWSMNLNCARSILWM